jgi:hypothetical protein
VTGEQHGTAIAADMSCTICGYNLRGLVPSKVCPECGTPIGRSVHGNLLRFAEPEWLTKLHLGVRLMLWGILISILVGAISLVPGVPAIYAGLAGLIAGGLNLCATFLLTTQEPRIAQAEDALTLRRVVRLCALSGYLGESTLNLQTSASMPLVMSVVGAIFALVGLVAWFGTFVYLRRFAARIPNSKLARSTTIVMWGFVTTAAVCAVAGLVVALIATPGTTPIGPPGPATVGPTTAASTVGGPQATLPGSGKRTQPAAKIGIGLVACTFGTAFVVFSIWYVILLFSYKNAFRTAATEARAPPAPAESTTGEPPQGPTDKNT